MPNDAKLGLAVGFGLVLTVAVLFFRQDSLSAPSPEDQTTIAVPAAPVSRSTLPLSHGKSVPAKKVSREQPASMSPDAIPDKLEDNNS